MPASTGLPIARYRENQVTNGGTTVQNISTVRSESRNVVDTKALQNITSRALTEIIQADIGGTISFKVLTPGALPVAIPPQSPNNPHTT